MTTLQHERRYFSRLQYRAYATLTTNHQRYSVHILDLSFNGALAALIDPHGLTAGEEIILNIETPEGERIKMMGAVAHQEEHFLGVECQVAGINNQTKLRKQLQQ